MARIRTNDDAATTYDWAAELERLDATLGMLRYVQSSSVAL